MIISYMKISLFVLVLFVIPFVSAQEAGISAKQKMDDIYELMDRMKLDSALLLANEFQAFVSTNPNIENEAQANLLLGMVYTNRSSNDSAKLFYRKAERLFRILKDTLMTGKLNARIGAIFRSEKNSDSAIAYYNKAYDFLHVAKDTLWIAFIKDNLGHIYYELGDYYMALKNHQAARLAYKALGYMQYEGMEYNAMGIVYRKTRDREKEKQCYLDAIEILSNINISIPLAESYSNLSELYLEDGDTASGFSMLENAKNIFIDLEFPLGLSSYYAVLAFYYENQHPPVYEKVIEYATKGAEIAFENKGFRQYADANYYLGSAYFHSNKQSRALEVLNEGLNVAEEYKYYPELQRITLALSHVYKKVNNPDKALEMLERHQAIKDSLASENKVKEFTSLDLSFSFRQEQYLDSIRQIQQKNQLLLSHEKELQTQQFRQLMLGFVILVILIVVVLILIFARRQKKQNILLDQKNQIINKSLYEKELLLKEIHHRVKNNFQTISSLLQLQSREVYDEKALLNIEEGQSRIRSMSLIHQKLYQNDDLSLIDFQDYLEQLSKQITGSYGLKNLEILIQATGINLDIDTSIPLGLILNELITNASKYAFNENEKGKLTITITQPDVGHYKLILKDSGPGLPLDINLLNTSTLGLRLVQRLTKQLHGNFEYKNENGSCFKITFLDIEHRKKTD